MKNLFFLLFCTVFSFEAAAQEGWSVGVEAMPNLFWMYNSKDREPDAFYQTEDPDFIKPNGIHTGINVKYAINERLEVGAGLCYSYGKQVYHLTNNPTRKANLTTAFRLDDFYTAFEHIKMPLSITGFAFEDGSSPYLQIGLVPTYLVGLKDYQSQVQTDLAGNELNHSIREQTLTMVTGKQQDNYNLSERVYMYEEKQFTYHEFGLEALLGLGYKVKVNNNIDIRIQTTGMLSIIDPETKLSYNWNGFKGRGYTFFINTGLSISSNYIF